MSVKQYVSKALSVLLPGGALGASIVLALVSEVPAAEAAQTASESDPSGSIAERLAQIRSGVSSWSETDSAPGSAESSLEDGPKLVPTWWGNGGWGRWRFGWGNGGWPNWHNWHNWGNGWHNGWHNFWHNW
jgi:rSAM-associated Gly-rich repeat protein